MIPSTEQQSLFQHYFNDTWSYDELQGEDGTLRPHWQTFFQSFSELGREEILNRNQDVLRFLKENGVTYNIYGDPAGQNRPWNLDLIPFLISTQEWQIIEAGLKQRAELFNHILKDIYGERRLIKNGLLPMELIYQHAGFLRQCAGIPLPGKRNLVVYSADMARASDGKIWILNDRTQAPSGSGYALENRMAMARMLPELFDGFKVRRLSSYFNSLRNALTGISPVQKNDPRIVILTPGPENETYFEHSYLSSYLGFILAQGDDLMVKDNHVFLKTIGGLEKVDVILRRVDDIYCDPLELKENSQLGVPGLVQAVRSGNVSIANPLGSSILENPGLMPFMQGMSKYFLGEELVMPNIASWWCGQPKELSYVLENLESFVIKRIYRDSIGHTSRDGSALSSAELDELKRAIKAHPHLYVGQEKVNISSTPSLIEGKIEPRTAIFRSFAVSTHDGYNVMTGGLTRTSAEKGNFIISNQLGGNSKDTWIISPENGNNYSVSKERIATIPSPSSVNAGIITSHTAENLFWVGRYAERVLGNARFQRTVMQFISEGDRMMADSDGITEKKLLETLTQCTFTFPGFTGKEGKNLREHPLKELREILSDSVRIGSLHYNFLMFKNAVYAVRDHWSTDTWRVLREMEECFNTDDITNAGFNRMMKVLDSLITSVMAFIGLNRESISREQGWNLLDAGRKTEQSLLLLNMLRLTLVAKQDEQVEYNLMEAVLKSHECLVNYRYKYRAHLQLPLVLDLMLLDPNNPRSLIYQLDRLKAYLSQLPKIKEDNSLAEHERLVLEAHTLLKLSSKDELAQLEKDASGYEKLEDFLRKMQSLMAAIQATVSKTYFKHAQAQKQLFTLDNL
jgi:uncharacterized circularly permuted ATP-grasp superfamily protein/uncharacterized alpha-E superfamily protein